MTEGTPGRHWSPRSPTPAPRFPEPPLHPLSGPPLRLPDLQDEAELALRRRREGVPNDNFWNAQVAAATRSGVSPEHPLLLPQSWEDQQLRET